ncbi:MULTISPECIES: hypothetical protein [unclassified Rhizobium]|jgi:hypothetical protein|uniref:hypothetical protein n=1 Tax=unclassified Rhizobium TaxID=2613769 RepID=UPI000DE1988C|nr:MULTISPECIES: hypothetical protein [unclassified Rhizobium]MBB3289709.1 hypothetical protein [Rhizobium sp. BK252]MBB3404652.1 hypothetical protein [Rhizobium sp. BK289]MBB3416976.1 hypothetical protein [Rhizobium sp. BK284]MBB3484853.1 hypothetical protein [Rhizobium sp. BK347]MDK4718216.1 hypothetical protein [Rhizobium sp. CNPSo 3968]
MARIVIIGLPDEKGLWVADIDAGTITPLQTPVSGALKEADDLRAGGAVIVKNVSLAVGVSSTKAVAGGFLEG